MTKNCFIKTGSINMKLFYETYSSNSISHLFSLIKIKFIKMKDGEDIVKFVQHLTQSVLNRIFIAFLPVCLYFMAPFNLYVILHKENGCKFPKLLLLLLTIIAN